MHNENREHLSQYRLEQSVECFKASQKLLDAQLYNDSINRSYYAIFHAIRSVLALSAIDFKRHKDVIAYFNKEYVKTEVFPRELGKRIGELKKIREKSDYSDFYIAPKEEAERQLETANTVLENVSRFLLYKYLDKGIDDMERGKTLPLEKVMDKITKLKKGRENTEQG